MDISLPSDVPMYIQNTKEELLQAQYRVQLKRKLRLNGLYDSYVNNLSTEQLETLCFKIS